MSAANAVDVTDKSAKKRKKNKKKAGNRQDGIAATGEANGETMEKGTDADEDDEENESALGVDGAGSGSLVSATPTHLPDEDSLHLPSSPPGSSTAESGQAEESVSNGTERQADQVQQGKGVEWPSGPNVELPHEQLADPQSSVRLDAIRKERDSLRTEVGQLRRQLESLRKDHGEDGEVASLREELEQSQQGKEHAETQYRNLLGKWNTIRIQLGERLKGDAHELEQARGRIEELEALNSTAMEDKSQLEQSISQLHDQVESQASEINDLRSRTTLSSSNWAKERDELVSKEAYIREEYDVAKIAMQDWEMLATEERARREALEERSQTLEDQLYGQKEAYERARDEAETQGSTVDGLQRALRELQEERKRELREMVEQSQIQLDELRKQAMEAEVAATELKQRLESTQKELDRALPFEKEVREKNLLIGKLRHEAVILNDHLTKALRFLKRGKPEDNVDRQLVTNHFLHFLAVDRSDPKKFQVLQLIAALLGWNEEQREQAGLLRQGSMTGTGSLKLPVSPFRRTPSTPSLSSDFVPENPTGAAKESLAELWSEFLEREAEAGGNRSRKGSTGTSVRSPSLSSAPLSSAAIASTNSPAERSIGEMKFKRKETAHSGTADK